MDWITTSTLLLRLRDFEDAEAWDGFVHRFRSPILRFAGSLGIRDTDAEDVAQETLLAFARDYREGRYDRERGRLSHWLFGIAYRRALAQRRRNLRRAEPLPDEDILPERTATDLWERHWS
jgi:DNA-directed RNA polymerase specialized sigma24 family protein